MSSFLSKSYWGDGFKRGSGVPFKDLLKRLPRLQALVFLCRPIASAANSLKTILIPLYLSIVLEP